MLKYYQTEDDSCIDLIRELAIHYASQEECLILVTMSMEGIVFASYCHLTLKDDLNNQSALKIAKDCDPNGSRTIGNISRLLGMLKQGC